MPALLTAAGIGMVIAGIFPTDAVRSGATADAVHSRASALATIALIGGRADVVASLRTPRRSLDAVLAILARLLGAVEPAVAPLDDQRRQPATPLADVARLAHRDRLAVVTSHRAESPTACATD